MDRIASQDRPDLYPNEIDDYLNRAIQSFIDTRYETDNQKKSGFETNQARIDELKNLHIKSPMVQPVLTPIDHGNGIYEIQLGTLIYRYLFLTKCQLKIVNNNCSKTIDHKSWQIDDVKTTFSDPSYKWSRVHANFGKSTSTSTDNKDFGSIYLDTTDKNGIQQFTISEAYVNYIKYPNRVCLGTYKHIDDTSGNPTTTISHCDIDSFFHDKIIDIAEYLIHKDIKDEFGYKSSQYEITKDL